MEVGRRGRGRGIHRAVDEGLREEIRILNSQLVVVEAGRRKDLDGGDDSDEEVAETTDGSDGEGPELKILRSVLLSNNKPKHELSNYDGSLSTKVLLDWLSELNKYFDYEDISEDKKVKFAATRLKGHASLWWESVQAERKRLNKQPIQKWTRMEAKLKGKFLPKEY